VTPQYTHRTAFGAWINDMHNQALPNEPWPYVVIDDQIVRDCIACLDLQSQAGFNEFDVFGLIAASAWPVDIQSAVGPERARRVKTILEAAHERAIKVIYGLGVYSWGFDRIIEADARVRGTNPHAMCGARAESWEWMTRVIDYILGEFEVDGFHLESSDLGRCSCPQCSGQGDVEYHCRLNARTADYIRSKWPDKILMVNMCGYTAWGSKLSAEDRGHLAELSRHLDYLIDPGHGGLFIEEDSRREFIKSLACDYGTSGGFWIYPPQPWDRLRWFLPYPMRTGRHLKQLYEDGGRAVEYYMGPTLNPGVEVNIAFGGKLLADVGGDLDGTLAEVLEWLYEPRDAAALRRLQSVFRLAEDAYFENWLPKPLPPREAPGELHLTALPFKNWSGTASPAYLSELRPGWTLMDAAGRARYRSALLSIQRDLRGLDDAVGQIERLNRIKTCVQNALADVEAVDAVAN
jgi:hypothetical protein